MTEPVFHAEKPILATHPVNGGDALIFSIAPPPPQWWWRALREHTAADETLTRPWDQEQQSRIAVVCPTREEVLPVIEAIDACVAQANADYARELELQHDSGVALRTFEADREQYRDDVQHTIDERYDAPQAAGV